MNHIPLNNIVRLARDFISIRSTEDNPTALDDILEHAIIQVPNLLVQRFQRNGKPSILIHSAKSNNNHFKIILNAHLDVVPGKEKQFIPIIKDGKLFGRGAYDMKSGAAVLLILFKELVDSLDYPLALQLVTDEESSGNDGTKLQIEKGITADFVIAGESTDHAIKTKSKGLLWIKITVQGKASHAAYPWLGNNAVQKMLTMLQKFNQTYPNPTTPAWQTTINIAKIETPNITFNKIPDICTAWLDIRYIPEEEKKIVQKIKNLLALDAEMEIIFNEKPLFTDPQNSFIQQLQEIIQKNTGSKAIITGAHGSTDMRFYTSLVHVPSIEYGPTGGEAHGDNEWVDIKSLEQYYAILKEFLLSLK